MQYADQGAVTDRDVTKGLETANYVKPRFRYDYHRRLWRWSDTGHLLRFCDICRGPHVRRGLCGKCQTARKAEIKNGRRIWLRASGRPHAYPLLCQGATQCVDCTKRGRDIRLATEWDHRDWREPLKVEPVCRNHNSQRGRAMTAYEASFQAAK